MKKLNTENKIPQYASRLSQNKVFQLLKFLLLLGLFISLFWIIPFENVWPVLQSVYFPFLAAGILISLLTIFIRMIRLSLLTRTLDLKISVLHLFKVNLIVKFYMLFLPGAMVGTGIRWVKISPEGKSAEALAAVGFNRLVETFFVVVTGMLWFFLGKGQQNINYWVILVFFLTIGILWLFFIFISKKIAAWFNANNVENFNPRWQRAWRYFQRIVDSINLYAGMTVKDMALLLGVSVLSHLVGLLSYSLIAKSSGINISILHLGWTQAVIMLASMTPVSIAGGLGLREASLVILLPLYGVTKETALGFSLLLLLRNFLLSVFGGLFELIDLLQKRAGSVKQEQD
jgi:uncharacterized protein (TIRG00374 family)